MDNLNEIRYQEYERKIAEQETIKKEYNLYSDTNTKAEKKESFLKKLFSRKNKTEEIEK